MAIFHRRRHGVIFESYVSLSDLPKLLEHDALWHVSNTNGKGDLYVKANIKNGDSYKSVPLHRFLLEPPPDMIVDHINHVTYDNRRENLRVVTPSENTLNRAGATANSKSGIRGVSWNRFRNKWRAAYCEAGVKIERRFKNKEDAVVAVLRWREIGIKRALEEEAN